MQNAGIDDALDLRHRALDLLGHLPGRCRGTGGDADVQRRRFSFVHGPADHAAGVEGEFQVAEAGIGGKARAEAADVFLSRLPPLVLQLDLDHGVHRAGVGRIGRRPVGRHADLADEQLQIVAQLLANELLHLRDIGFGDFDPRAAGGPHVDLEGPGVDLREELAAEPGAQQKDRGDQQAQGRGRSPAQRWRSTTARPRS